MPILDKIRISGTTYDIGGSGGSNVVELTQAEYDALATKDSDTFYIITDAQAMSITVDSALDGNSTNPVQNKVICAAIGDIETLLSQI